MDLELQVNLHKNKNKLEYAESCRFGTVQLLLLALGFSVAIKCHKGNGLSLCCSVWELTLPASSQA